MLTLELNNAKYSHKSWTCSFTGSFRTDQWTVICGPSGGGKSTLLQMILGLIPVHDGNISIDSRTIINTPPHLRGMGYLGQSNMLFPGISILENLFLTFHASHLDKNIQRNKIDEIITSLNLDQDTLTRFPDQLSGGQLSRCNLARAALQAREWLLLDEPFAALDRITRLAILAWLNKWRRDKNLGILFVAHDLDDVLTVASNIAVIDQGSIIESNSINEIINSPTRTLSAQILGNGIVMKKSQSTSFIGARHLKTSREEVVAPPESIECLTLSDPKTYSNGTFMRIIDFQGDCDVTLLESKKFSGKLWFNKDATIPLKP